MGAHGRSGKVYTINGDYKQILFPFNPLVVGPIYLII